VTSPRRLGVGLRGRDAGSPNRLASVWTLESDIKRDPGAPMFPVPLVIVSQAIISREVITNVTIGCVYPNVEFVGFLPAD
jgi:hypothetical protein